MTEQDIIEVLAHPRAQKLLRKMVLDILHEEMLPKFKLRPERQVRVKEAPPGMLTYKDAMALSTLSYSTLRHYVHEKKIVGNRGLLSKASLQAYLEHHANRNTQARLQ